MNVKNHSRTDQKLVSIIVIFNQFRREKLVRLLESMKEQVSIFPTEVLLLHESNTVLAAPELPLAVRYFTIPEKQGIPFNRNQGIKQARGELIVFIDDDCWVHGKWLSSLLRPLQENPDLLAVTSGTKIPPSNFLGNCISALGFPGGGSLGFEKIWKVSEGGFTTHLAAGNCCLRKEIFDKVGLFDETMKYGAEDAELSYRLEKAKIPIKYSPEAYAFHEARTTWSSFLQWQLRRGKANYHFKKKINRIKPFVQLRAWSALNVLKHNFLSLRFPVVAALLGISFAVQQTGYTVEAIREWKNKREGAQ